MNTQQTGMSVTVENFVRVRCNLRLTDKVEELGHSDIECSFDEKSEKLWARNRPTSNFLKQFNYTNTEQAQCDKFKRARDMLLLEELE